MPNTYFPVTPQDELTEQLLDQNNKVTYHEEHSKFLPYEDPILGHVSPFTDFIYYHKLPQVYRDYDMPITHEEDGQVRVYKPLYTYLQCLIEGGYADLVSNAVSGEYGIDELFNLIDPQTCPSEFLPIYCKSMGIEWFQDLVVSTSEDVDSYYYMRTVLSNIGEVYKRRGTESVVKYIAKVLTSKDVKINYTRTITDGETKSRSLWVEIQVNSPEEVSQVKFNAEVIQRFINTQIPYYLTSKVLYVIDKGDIQVVDYMSHLVTKTQVTTITPTATYIADDTDFIYLIQNDEVTILSYIGSATRVAVPRRIQNKPVTVIAATAFSYNPSLEYVKLPNTVRTIE